MEKVKKLNPRQATEAIREDLGRKLDKELTALDISEEDEAAAILFDEEFARRGREKAEKANLQKTQKSEPQDPKDILIAEEPEKDKDIEVPVEPVEIVKPAEIKEAEKNPELEKLEREVEEARKKYAESDYKVTNTFAKLKNFFGRTFNNDPAVNSDTVYYYKNYRKALGELREFRVQSIKEKYSGTDNSPARGEEEKMQELKKEVGELIAYFNKDEKLNLYDARTNARAEAREGKSMETIVKKSSEIINWYRKLNWKKKLAFSGLLLVGGVGATMAATAGIAGGAGVATFIVGAKIGQRIVGGATTGVGATLGLESLARRKEEKKSEKNKKELLAEFENDWESKFDAISNYCEKEISDYGKSLQKEKQKAKERRLFGVLIATFAGSGLAADLAKAGFGWAKEGGANLLHKFEVISEPAIKPSSIGSVGKSALGQKIDGGVSENNLPGADAIEKPSAGKVPENITKGPQAISENVSVPEVPRNIIDIDIKKGDSIEGNIIKQLDDHGIKGVKAENLAHNMALDYAKVHKIPFDQLNHIQPGDHLEFKIDPSDLKNSKIIDFERAAAHIKGAHNMISNEILSVAGEAERSILDTPSSIAIGAVAGASLRKGFGKKTEAADNIGGTEGELKKTNEKISFSTHDEWLAENSQHLFKKEFGNSLRDIRQIIFNDPSEVRKNGGVAFKKYARGNNNFADLEKNLKGIIETAPLKDETVNQWTMRMTAEALREGKFDKLTEALEATTANKSLSEAA